MRTTESHAKLNPVFINQNIIKPRNSFLSVFSATKRHIGKPIKSKKKTHTLTNKATPSYIDCQYRESATVSNERMTSSKKKEEHSEKRDGVEDTKPEREFDSFQLSP